MTGGADAAPRVVIDNTANNPILSQMQKTGMKGA